MIVFVEFGTSAYFEGSHSTACLELCDTLLVMDLIIMVHSSKAKWRCWICCWILQCDLFTFLLQYLTTATSTHHVHVVTWHATSPLSLRPGIYTLLP